MLSVLFWILAVSCLIVPLSKWALITLPASFQVVIGVLLSVVVAHSAYENTIATANRVLLGVAFFLGYIGSQTDHQKWVSRSRAHAVIRAVPEPYPTIPSRFSSS